MIITKWRGVTVNQRNKRILKILVLISVTLLSGVLQFSLDGAQYLQPAEIKIRLGSMGNWAPFG